MAKRYGSIIGPEYDANKIYVRATDVDRTIASALSNLAGMFPPAGYELWNPEIKWQPIPVHTVPAQYDYVIGSAVPSCPAYEKAYKQALNSTKLNDVIKEVEPLLKYISANAGFDSHGFVSDLLLGDTLYIEGLKSKL